MANNKVTPERLLQRINKSKQESGSGNKLGNLLWGKSSAIPRAKIGEQIKKPTERFSPLDEETTYEEPSRFAETVVSPSSQRYSLQSNIPGQFTTTPEGQKIVRSSRTGRDEVTSKEKAAYRGPYSGGDVEIDHVIPLWLGGTNAEENLRALPKALHQDVVTKAQGVIRTLFRNPALTEKYLGRKLSLAEARNYAINSTHVNPKLFKGLIFDEKEQLVSKKGDDDAVKKGVYVLQHWNDNPINVGDVLSPKALSEAGETLGTALGKKMPDTPSGEFVKGAVSGLTLGHITYAEENAEPSAKNQLAGMLGNITGGLASMLLGGAAIKGVLGTFGAEAAAAGKLGRGAKFLESIRRINPSIAKAVEKAVTPKAKAIDVTSKRGLLSRIFKKTKAQENPLKSTIQILEQFKPSFKQGFKKRFAEDALIFGTIGQLSKQEDDEISTRAKRLLQDLAYGGLTAAVPGGLSRKLATVWLGSGLIDSVAGATPGEAATNATIMTLFHGIGGFRNSGLTEDAIHNYSVGVAQKTRNKWLNKIGRETEVPTTIPLERLPDDLPAVEQRINAETEDILRRIEADTSMSTNQKDRETQAAILSGHQLFLNALPPEVRGGFAHESMVSIARRLERNSDSVAEIFNNGDSMAKASSNFDPIPSDDAAAATFSTKGMSGKLSDSSAEDVAKLFAGENLKLQGDQLQPVGKTEAFLVKVPYAEGKSSEVPNPSAFGETKTVHTQDVYELQIRDATGRIYHLGMANEAEARPVFNDLRSRGINRVEAKLDYVVLGDGNVEVRASIPQKALDRVDEFNQHVDAERRGVKTRKEVVEPKQVGERVELAPLSEQEVQPPIKEEGRYVQLEKKVERAEEERARLRGKFKQGDLDRISRYDIPMGNMPSGAEVAMTDKRLLTAVRDTAIRLNSDDLPRDTRIKLTAQANKLKDEIINHRPGIREADLNRIGHDVMLTKYSIKKTVDPTIKKLADEKIKQGVPKERAIEEATEDMIAFDLLGKPLPRVKEVPEESLLDRTRRLRKKRQEVAPEEAVEVSTTETAEATTVPTAKTSGPSEVVTRKMTPEEAAKNPPEGKVYDREKNVEGRTREQQHAFNRAKSLIDTVIENSDRPKDETPSAFINRLIQDVESEVIGGERGLSSVRRRRINIEKEGRVPKFESPYLPGRPSGAYIGAGQVLRSGDIELLREYAKVAAKAKAESLRGVETRYKKAAPTPREELAAPGRAQEPYELASTEEQTMARKLRVAQEKGLIDMQSYEGRAAQKAVKMNDADAMRRNAVLRYLPDFNEDAQAAIESFESLSPKLQIGVSKDDFVKTFVDLELVAPRKGGEIGYNVDPESIPEKILMLEPIRQRITELDPLVELRVRDYMIGGMSKTKAWRKALKEAQINKLRDVDLIDSGNKAFDAEVSSGNVKDTNANREQYLRAFFYADDSAAGDHIRRLASIKKRVEKSKDINLGGGGEFSGRAWGMSKKTLDKVVKDLEAIRNGEEPSFSYRDESGNVKPMKNALSIAMRESADTANDPLARILWEGVEREAGLISKRIDSQGGMDFREWDVPNPVSIFDSKRASDSGFNRHVTMSKTQALAYMWRLVSDFLNVPFEDYKHILGEDTAKRLSSVQEMALRRIDEINQKISNSGLSDSKKAEARKKIETTVWTSAETELLPTEVSLTNLARAVDRLETDFGKSMMALAENADQVRAVEDYLGTGSDVFITDYPELLKYAEEYDIAKSKKVTLEHAEAVRRGEIRGSKARTPKGEEIATEMQERAGTPEGYVSDESLNEYAISELTLFAPTDPAVREYLRNLPSDRARAQSMRSLSRYVANQFVDAAEESIRVSKWIAGEKFEGALKRSEEIKRMKDEIKDILQERVVGPDPRAQEDNLKELRQRLAKKQNQPFKVEAMKNKRYSELVESAMQPEGTSSVSLSTKNKEATTKRILLGAIRSMKLKGEDASKLIKQYEDQFGKIPEDFRLKEDIYARPDDEPITLKPKKGGLSGAEKSVYRESLGEAKKFRQKIKNLKKTR